MRVRLPLLLPALLLLASACSSGEGTGGASGDNGGTLIISAPAEAEVLIPPLVFSTAAKQVTDQIFEALADIPPSLNTIGDEGWTPRLASSWTWAQDSMSIAFHIDPKARWHDDTPVRASDVRFTHAVYKDPATGTFNIDRFENLDSVSVTDSLTATVWFHARSPEQFFQAAFAMYILPEHLLGRVPHDSLATSDYAKHPVGSGPFRLARWEPRSVIELVADTAYHLGRARLDRLVWSYSTDLAGALVRVIAGEADFVEQVSPDGMKQVQAAAELRAHPYQPLNYAYIGFNFRDPADARRPHRLFTDAGVRRALTMALDRRAMLRNVFDTLAVVPIGPFPLSFFTADTTLPVIPYDTAGATRLLDSLGFRDTNGDGVRERNGVPLKFSVMVPAPSVPRRRFAELMQEQFRRIGARMDVDLAEGPALGPRMATGQFDVLINFFQVDPNPSGIKQDWGSVPPTARGSNSSAYANPRFDATLDSAIAERSPARSRDLYRRAYRIIIEDAGAIWLYETRPRAVMHRRIRPVMDRADTWWRDLRLWSIPASERIARDRIGLMAPDTSK